MFISALLAVLISRSIPNFLHLPDKESFLLITAGLLFVCCLLIIPFALKALAPGKAALGGLHFVMMLLPLLLTFSLPVLSLTPFARFAPAPPAYSVINTWLFNLAGNTVIFYLTGVIYIKINNHERTSWLAGLPLSLLLVSIYLFSVHTGLLEAIVP